MADFTSAQVREIQRDINQWGVKGHVPHFGSIIEAIDAFAARLEQDEQLRFRADAFTAFALDAHKTAEYERGRSAGRVEVLRELARSIDIDPKCCDFCGCERPTDERLPANHPSTCLYLRAQYAAGVKAGQYPEAAWEIDRRAQQATTEP